MPKHPEESCPLRFVSGVFVQIHGGEAIVSLFIRDAAEAELIEKVGQEIVHLLRTPC
jgi:hypothetical protein